MGLGFAKIKGIGSTSPVTRPVARSATPATPSPTGIAKNMLNTSLTGAQNALVQPFSLAGLGKSPYAEDFANQRQQNIDATYNMFARRQEPIFEQQNKDFIQSMADRGIQGGNELYNRNYGAMAGAQNDARLQAMDAARLAGGNEQSRMYGMASDARQNALNEYQLGRSQPLQEATQLAGLWKGLATPTGGGGGGGGGGSGGGLDLASLLGLMGGGQQQQPVAIETPSQPSLGQSALYAFGAPMAQKAISAGADWLVQKGGDFLGGLFK